MSTYFDRYNHMKYNKRKGGKIMESIRKTIIFDEKTVKRIEEMAKEAERDFSGQVRFIIKEYIGMMERK